MCAAEKGEVEAVELLLSKGANIEAADKVIIFK
jgi:ankyrin repeat protein